MNERQKKIMVPYEEKTDTCPDCSSIPCDCGLPAGYTPTLRTDDGGRYCSHQRRERWIKTVPLKTSEELQTELAAVTEQRDRLTEALNRISEYQGVDDEDTKTMAIEALQSLNQPTP